MELRRRSILLLLGLLMGSPSRSPTQSQFEWVRKAHLPMDTADPARVVAGDVDGDGDADTLFVCSTSRSSPEVPGKESDT
jgi:hypothetical protein